MSLHLQRLLARVGPPAPGFALAMLPVAPVASPLADGDQRIGMPEFLGAGLPLDAGGETVVDSEVPTPRADATPPRASRPARPAPSPAMPGATESAPATIIAPPPAAVTAATPAAPISVAPPPSNLAGPVEIPAALAPLLSPFAIAPDDFEPAPVARPAEPENHASPAKAAEPAPLADTGPAITTPPAAVPAPIAAEAMPLRAPARAADADPAPPMHRAAEPVLFAATPALAPVADLPIAAAGKAAMSRNVVIEEVVIDIVPPPAPTPAAPRDQPAQARDRAGAPAAAPLSAEAASIIGPLPVSRPFATLFGMRRR